MSKFSLVLFTAPAPYTSGDANSAVLKIDGREALLRSVELFLNRDPITQIQLCFAPDFVEEAKKRFGGHLGFSGVKLISGGPRWIDQLHAAVEKLSPDSTHVIVHDAARPAVPYDDIDAILAAATKPGTSGKAFALTAPLRSGLLELDEAGQPVAVAPASRFVQMLTPLVFTRARFDQLAREKKEPHASEFTLVKGSGLNVRVNSGADAGFVKAMINMLPKPKLKAPSSPFDEAQW